MRGEPIWVSFPSEDSKAQESEDEEDSAPKSKTGAKSIQELMMESGIDDEDDEEEEDDDQPSKTSAPKSIQELMKESGLDDLDDDDD